MNDRYHRQTFLPQIGAAGQRRLAEARVLLVGCGALGSVIADQLVRAGVGFLRIVDRDIVELTNLQRQVLFDEADAREAMPKAVAAAARLGRINSETQIDPLVEDVRAGNIEDLLIGDGGGGGSDEKVQLILDGTDNVQTRYLINDAAIKHRIPWVYGACIGTEGRVMVIRPGHTACLRCIFSEPPGPGELPTCDTAGVLGAAANIVASLQCVAAIKLLTAPRDAVAEEMLLLDVWTGRFRTIDTRNARRPDCPACGRGDFEFLDRPAAGSVSLCGRDAVQVHPKASIDTDALARRLAGVGNVRRTPYFIRCELAEAGINMTIFNNGRAIIQGTGDPARARSIYARYIGS